MKISKLNHTYKSGLELVNNPDEIYNAKSQEHHDPLFPNPSPTVALF